MLSSRKDYGLSARYTLTECTAMYFNLRVKPRAEGMKQTSGYIYCSQWGQCWLSITATKGRQCDHFIKHLLNKQFERTNLQKCAESKLAFSSEAEKNVTKKKLHNIIYMEAVYLKSTDQGILQNMLSVDANQDGKPNTSFPSPEKVPFQWHTILLIWVQGKLTCIVLKLNLYIWFSIFFYHKIYSKPSYVCTVKCLHYEPVHI